MPFVGRLRAVGQVLYNQVRQRENETQRSIVVCWIMVVYFRCATNQRSAFKLLTLHAASTCSVRVALLLSPARPELDRHKRLTGTPAYACPHFCCRDERMISEASQQCSWASTTKSLRRQASR